MSILIKSFDPTSASLLDARGIGLITTNGHNQNEQLVLYNSSLVCFQLTFLDETTDIMPPSWAKSFKKPGPIGNIRFQPIFTLPAVAGAQPISTCYGAVYEKGEQVADLNAPLQYVYNIGNAVNSNVSSFVLTNTGNPPLTNVIDVQPSDAASPTILADNSGNFTVKGDNSGTLTTLIQLIAGASPAVKLAAAGIIAEALGGLKVDQNFSVVGSSSLDNGNVTTDGTGNTSIATGKTLTVDGVTANAAAALTLGVVTGQTIFTKIGANLVSKYFNNGSHNIEQFLDGGIQGPTGDTLCRIGSSAGTGSGTFTHSTGAVPDYAAFTTHAVGSQTVGYDSETSTQFHVTMGNTLSWFGLTTKRT